MPSFAQQRIWFVEQLTDLGSMYHIAHALRARGSLDWSALRRALDQIVARHEVLRTTFPAIDGEPVQRVGAVEDSRLSMIEHDLGDHPDCATALGAIMAEEARAPLTVPNE